MSRSTVRHSLKELGEMGLVQTRHGAGTVVTGPDPEGAVELSGFTEDIRARGLVPSSDVLRATWSADPVRQRRCAPACRLARGC